MASEKLSLSEILCEELKCGICLQRFKNPRALSCLHSFCEKCLEKYQTDKGSASSIPCHLCQQDSAIPKGGVTALTLDFRAMKLIRVLEDENAKSARLSIACDICGKNYTEGNGPHGFIHCSECTQTMCERCGRAHGKMKGTRNHTVTGVPEQVLMEGVEDSGAYSSKKDEVGVDVSTFCQNHADMKIRFFCTVCKIPICDTCSESDHRAEEGDHEHVPINELASTLKERIGSILERVHEKSEEFASFISVLDTVDKSMLIQDEIFDNKVKLLFQREKKRLEQSMNTTHATRNSFLETQRQNLNELRQNAKKVKETLALCETEARTILEQESNDVAVVLSHQNLQLLQETLDKVMSEKLDLSLLQKISDTVSQQLHIHASKDYPSLGSVVMAIRDRRNISIHSCTGGPYSMTFTKDGRLAVLANFEGAASQPDNTDHYTRDRQDKYHKINRQPYLGSTYKAVKQTDVKYEYATQFELETRIQTGHSYIASLSDLRFVLMDTYKITAQPGGQIASMKLRGLATDHADNIYATDDKGTIRVFRPNGAFKKSIETGGLNKVPERVDFLDDGDEITLTLTCSREADVILFTHNNCKISVVDQGGNILSTITRPEWKYVTIGCDDERLLYVLWKGADGRKTLQRYTLYGHLIDTLFENETHGCKDLILSVSPDGTAAVVTNTAKDAQVTLVSTAKKITNT